MIEPGTAAQAYASGEESRKVFLDRARDCSKFTIPSLVPPEGFNETSELYQPYQSLGARGVNHLAGKLLLALMPPNIPFFRFSISPKIQNQLDELAKQLPPGSPSIAESFREGLAKQEDAISAEIPARSARIQVFVGLKHLLVSGNALLYIASPKSGNKANSFRVFPLSQYTVERDPAGNVLTMIVKECISPESIEDAVFRKRIKELAEQRQQNQELDDADEVDLFTVVSLTDGKWSVHQEVLDQVVPGSDGTYPLHACPWIPLCWSRNCDEDYGRGYCEEYFGDLVTLENFEKNIVEFAAAASRVVFLCNPAGMTDPRRVEEAANLDSIPGRQEDIGTVQMNKTADFQVVKAEKDSIEQRLSYAFLLNSAIQRDAERVTAVEIRYMANELENALGGVYSLLATELQLPIVYVLIHQMQRSGDLPTLPKGSVTPTIVTGVDALGRSQEVDRWTTFLQLAGAVGPEAQKYINAGSILRVLAVGCGVKADEAVRTDAEVQQEQQAMQQAALLQKVGPAGIKAVSDQITNQSAQPSQQ